MYRIGMTQWIVGDEPLEISCARMNRYGYDEIEFAADPHRLDADVCRALMVRYHLSCHSLCGLFDETRDLTDDGENGRRAVQYLKDSVDFAQKVGAGIIIVVPSPVGRAVKPEGIPAELFRENAVRNIREAADYAKAHNVRFVIEAINRYETWFINTLAKARDLVDEIDHPAVGFMADLFHMSLEEASITDSLYRVSDRLWHVHVADNTREAAGMGSTDFKEILRTLLRIGYQGSLTMEFMYRLSDPYSAQELSTQTDRMDHYAKQAIDYIRMMERSVEEYKGI
ncbi:MAG: sugar phosphate isomerase/epimerase [Clostridiales bacterium]|nr:sugar phosphate isomerase/epimerase [Clostridiales bacterium]